MGRAVGFVAALLVLASNAGAITWDLSGTGGDLGTAAVPFISGSATITVTAWTLSSGTFTVQHLFQRNEGPDDRGLGVCNSFDDGGGSSCLSIPNGNGDNNEIDNNGGKQDDGTSGNIDNFQIFGSNLVNPALADNGSTVFLLASGRGCSPGGVDPSISLAGSYRYLYVTTSTGSGDDDFLASLGDHFFGAHTSIFGGARPCISRASGRQPGRSGWCRRVEEA